MEPASGPPDRSRHRTGTPARARAGPRRRPGAAGRDRRAPRWPRRRSGGRAGLCRPACPAGRPVRTWRGRHVVVSPAARVSTVDPVRFLGQPLLGAAGVRACRGRAPTRGAQVTLVAANVRSARPGGGRGAQSPPTTERAAPRSSRRSARADALVMAAAPPTSGRRPPGDDEDQEGRTARAPVPWSCEQHPRRARRGGRPPAGGPRRRWSWSASPRRPGTRAARCWTRARQARCARAATCSWSTTSAAGRCSRLRRRGDHRHPARARGRRGAAGCRVRGRARRGGPGPQGRRRRGGRGTWWPGARPSRPWRGGAVSPVVPAHPRRSALPPVHLRVGDRGPPGQDLPTRSPTPSWTTCCATTPPRGWPWRPW